MLYWMLSGCALECTSILNRAGMIAEVMVVMVIIGVVRMVDVMMVMMDSDKGSHKVFASLERLRDCKPQKLESF